MENSPQCMTYIPWKTNSMNEDTLLFGDDQGYVNMLTISSKDLHMKNSSTKADSVVVNIEPSKLSSEIKRRKFHDDWVLKIKYFPQLEMFGSCSPSSTCSFVLGNLDRVSNNSPVRELAVPKGVNCFDYCMRANVIITAGADKIVRIWHPLIFTRPTGKLIGHLFTIVEVCVNEKDQQLISLSTARVFRVWDIQTLTCLQVFTDNEVRPGEKRISSMLFDAKNDRLITGCSVIDTWPLTRAIQDSLQVPHTHDRPLSQLLYNPHMSQVISVCTEGIMKVWEMETGQAVYQVPDAHGPSNEITAMNIDNTGYRLVTGAYDGSIKAWDFGSGQLYKSFPDEPKHQENTITGLVYHIIGDRRCVLVSSWGKGIRILEDCYDLPMFSELRILSDSFAPPIPVSVPEGPTPFISRAPLPGIGQEPNSSKQINLLRSCEVTCLEYCSGSLLMAGTSDGAIIMWNLKTEKVISRFLLPATSGSAHSGGAKRQRREDQSLVHACRFLVHKVRRPIIYGERAFHLHTVEEESETELETEKSTSHMEEAEEKDPEKSGSISEAQDKGDVEMKEDEEDNVDIKSDGEQTDREQNDENDDTKNDGNDEKHDDGGDDNEHSPYLRISDPAVLSCHHDGYLRFWNLEGRMLNEIRAVTRRQASAVTCVTTDVDCNYVISGDAKGYVTVWEVGSFLLDPPKDTKNSTKDNEEQTSKKKEPKNVIKQIVCWRAHLTRIVGIEHLEGAEVVVTASTDCSVRVWYRDTGHFIGFFGQPRLWHLPSSKSVPSTPVRPYDITEVPIKTLKNLSTKSTTSQESSVDCPLMFDDNRWYPFRHSAKEETRAKGNAKKFFDSLSKPKHYNSHLQSSRTGSPETGAVFRALPVYRIETPERLKTPAVAQQSTWITNQPNGAQSKAAQGNKPTYTYRSTSPIKEQVVSRFPHLVQANRR